MIQHIRSRIRAHAVNLYQRGAVKEQLKQCVDKTKFRLSLWYSVRKNNEYIRVSPIWYSNLAQESKIPTQFQSNNLILFYLIAGKGSQTEGTEPTAKGERKSASKKSIKKR